MQTSRILLRSGAASALAIGLIASAGAASAHVHVDPEDAGAGEATTLTFSFGHGCDGSPTERLEIQIPESVTEATPLDADGWSFDTTTDSDGRVATIVFTADTPIPDHDEASVDIDVTIPDIEPGTVLEFPTVQVCPDGEAAWVQTTADDTEPDYPAPAVTVTEGSGPVDAEPNTGGDETDAEPTSAASEAPDTDEDDEGSNTLLWVGVGVLALATIGGVVLFRSRAAS